MGWKTDIEIAISEAEVATGFTPLAIIVRPEVYSELCMDIYGSIEYGELSDIGGILVSVNDTLHKDFVLTIDIYAVGQEV